MNRLPVQRPSRPAPRGAASLVVVMILFFIITLVAAYTSRNLLFEQRTSTNQYRSTLAFQAAEAGVEWALARLNDARMNNDCTPFTTAAAAGTNESFRQRYVSIDENTGLVTPALDTSVTPAVERLAGCTFSGTDWVCDCPATGEPNPVVATFTGSGPFAAFWVRFQQVAAVPGAVRVQVNACTRADPACLRFNRLSESGDGLSTVWSMVTLRSALGSAPTAALTASGAVDANGRQASVISDDPAAGTTVTSGLTVDNNTGTLRLTAPPGTPPALSLQENEASLQFPALAAAGNRTAKTAGDMMFNSLFGMWPGSYLGDPAATPAVPPQPGVAQVPCTAGCTAADVIERWALHPGHAVHVHGGGTLNVGADIGTAAEPVLIIADGQVVFGGAHTIFGVVYSRAGNWQINGDGAIRGAAIAEGAFTFLDDDTVLGHDPAVLRRLRYRHGTFVKVPGGWRDFQP